jgi:hypothetical protein
MQYSLSYRLGGFAPGLDPDAKAYINAVENADTQALERVVKIAINNLVLDLKDNSLWDKIKAMVLLAGPRTINGVLVPLKGTAPTQANFVIGDLDRKTGLKGNTTNKRIDTSRSNNADPQDDNHNSVWVTQVATVGAGGAVRNLMANSATGQNQIAVSGDAFNTLTFKSRGRSSEPSNTNNVTGFWGTTRTSSTAWQYRVNGATTTGITTASVTPSAENLAVFARNADGFYTAFADARIAVYTIGESLNLATLDTVIGGYITELASAIP